MTKTNTKPKTNTKKCTKAKTTTTCKCKGKNKKGFTLVELLAVIIILAIVVGITIPAIMTTVGNARQSAFNSAAQSCADFIERQYNVYLVDKNDPGLNTNLKGLLDSASTLNTNKISNAAQSLGASLVEACGLKSTNIASAKFKLNNGRVCIILQAATGKDYAGYGTFTSTGATSTSLTDYMVGGACKYKNGSTETNVTF